MTDLKVSSQPVTPNTVNDHSNVPHNPDPDEAHKGLLHLIPIVKCYHVDKLTTEF